MKTTKTNKVALNDQNLAGRRAKQVKGGPIYMGLDAISGYSSKATISGYSSQAVKLPYVELRESPTIRS